MEYDVTVIHRSVAALVRALLGLRAQRLSQWRAASLLASFSLSHCPPRSCISLWETSAFCAVAHGSLRGRLAQRRSLTEIQVREDGKPRDQYDAAPKEVVSPTR